MNLKTIAIAVVTGIAVAGAIIGGSVVWSKNNPKKDEDTAESKEETADAEPDQTGPDIRSEIEEKEKSRAEEGYEHIVENLNNKKKAKEDKVA